VVLAVGGAGINALVVYGPFIPWNLADGNALAVVLTVLDGFGVSLLWQDALTVSLTFAFGVFGGLLTRRPGIGVLTRVLTGVPFFLGAIVFGGFTPLGKFDLADHSVQQAWMLIPMGTAPLLLGGVGSLGGLVGAGLRSRHSTVSR